MNKEYKDYEKLPLKKYPAALIEWYSLTKKQGLNLLNPQTFGEKMQWLKLFDSTPTKTRLADKYLVRDWVKEKIGAEYLVPIYGVYDNFEDIDFDKLPNRFVIKCTHGAGWNYICLDKQQFDKNALKLKFDAWLKTNYAFQNGFELHYRDIQPRIIIEEYLPPEGAQYEWQLWVFNKEIKFVSIETIKDLTPLKRCVFYPDGSKADFKISPQHYQDLKICPSMEIMKKAIKLAQKLLIDTPYVRIDFAQYKDNIKFREMTFTSGSGLSVFQPKECNIMLGKMMKLPKRAYNINTGRYYNPFFKLSLLYMVFYYKYFKYMLLSKITFGKRRIKYKCKECFMKTILFSK